MSWLCWRVAPPGGFPTCPALTALPPATPRGLSRAIPLQGYSPSLLQKAKWRDLSAWGRRERC